MLVSQLPGNLLDEQFQRMIGGKSDEFLAAQQNAPPNFDRFSRIDLVRKIKESVCHIAPVSFDATQR